MSLGSSMSSFLKGLPNTSGISRTGTKDYNRLDDGTAGSGVDRTMLLFLFLSGSI